MRDQKMVDERLMRNYMCMRKNYIVLKKSPGTLPSWSVPTYESMLAVAVAGQKTPARLPNRNNTIWGIEGSSSFGSPRNMLEVYGSWLDPS
jgi:hypothetical protein